MTISEAARTYLLAQGSLSDLIGSRLTPEVGGQDPQAPYVVYHIEIRNSEERLDSSMPCLDAIFDFVIVSSTYDEAFQIAEILRTLLDFYSGVMGGVGGLQVAANLNDIVGGYTKEFDLFGANANFTLQYIPQ